MVEEYVLPVRPSLVPGESLLGYLQRLAEAHCCETVSWIAERARVDIQNLAFYDVDLSRLSTMTLLDVSVLRAMQYRSVDEDVVIFNRHRLHRNLIRNAYPKVCGPCLRETGYHRAVWDLAFIGFCPKHRARLFDTCRECGERLKWTTPSVVRCRCGANLALQQGEAVREEEAEAASVILERFDKLPDREADAAIFNSPDDLPPGEFIEFLLFAGRNALSVETGTSQTGRTLDRSDLGTILSLGVEVSRHWPIRFHGLLDRVQGDKFGDSRTTSLSARFGQIYKTIARLKPSGWSGVAREGFREYLRANSDIPILVNSPLVDGLERERDYITLEEAASILQVARRTLDRMLRSPTGHSFRSTARDGRRLLYKADVEAFGEKLLDTINLVELRDRLGVGVPSTVRMVARSGIFAMRERVEVGGKRAAAVVASDVDAFFHRLDADASGQALTGGAKSFTETWDLAQAHGFDLPGLLLLIKHGKIKPVGMDEHGGAGLNRYLFDGEAVKTALALDFEEKTGAMSAVVAAERLGVPLWAVYKMAEADLLEGRRVTDLKGLCITSSSITKFHKRYATSSTIGREMNVNGRTVNGALKRLAVVPHVQVSSPSGVINVYRRSSIDFSALEAIVRS